jgi:hypothetical protein
MLDTKKRFYVWVTSTLFVGIVCLLLIAVPSYAQEKSVHPDINDTQEALSLLHRDMLSSPR